MFGYIKTYRPELKMREDEAYKALYCSLCKELGKKYGIVSRLFLSYDAAFLAASLMALSDKTVCFNKKRCPFNPAKKCSFCTERQEEISLAADVSVLLLYYKIADNIKDSTLFKAILYRILLILILPSYKKAKKYNPDAEKIINNYSERQTDVENNSVTSTDIAAEPTAVMLSEIFTLSAVTDDDITVRKHFGYFLGKWIYLMDAYDDLEKDEKSDNYNPYIANGTTDNDKIKGDLLMTAGEVTKAFDLLDIKKFEGIIKNIVYDGLYYQTMKIYERRQQNE